MYFGKNELCKNRSTSNWQETYSFWNLAECICKPSAWLLSTCGWVLIWHQGEKGWICGRKYKAVLTQAPKGCPKCCPNTWKRTKSPMIEHNPFSDALNWWLWWFQNGLPLAMALPWVAVSVGSCWFVSLRPSFGGCQLSYDPNNLLNSFPWQKLKKIWKLVSYLDSDFWWVCGDGLWDLEMVESLVE